MAGRDKAFGIFVKQAIASIQKESWGRAKEAKDLRESCQNFLNILEQHETGAQPYEGSLAHAVLQPLLMACAVANNVKIVELALGALHKLVAYAWLQGESSTSEELLGEETDTVAKVIKRVIKCGEINNSDLQLAVIKGLLTFSTAEHFIAHGDSLMSAVRAVFNLALGGERADIKRTACNALLQMLNTIAKRVTAYSYSACATPVRRESDHDGDLHGQQSVLQQPMPSQLEHQLSMAAAKAEKLAEAQHHGQSESGNAADLDTGTADARTAQLTQLAEQHDIRGLEAAIGASLDEHASGRSTVAPPSPTKQGRISGTASTLNPSDSISTVQATNSVSLNRVESNVGRPPSLIIPTTMDSNGHILRHEPPVQLTVLEKDVLLVLTAFCKLASREAGLTEVESYLHQGKLLALELLVKVLQNPQHKWENVRSVFTRALRQPLCFTLLKNWAATDPAAFQQAIKLLLSIMTQPKLRAGLKAELGAFYSLFVLLPLEQGCLGPIQQPINDGSGGAHAIDDVARAYAKAQNQQTDLHTLHIVLTNLATLSGDVQLVVDIFVNYDCDAQAPPLYERTMKVLGRIAQRAEITDKDRQAAGPGQPPAKQQQEATARLAAVRQAALKCLTGMLNVLQQWSGPLQQQQKELRSLAGAGGVESGMGDVSEGGAVGEAERLEAAWAQRRERDTSLAKAVSMFNAGPNKGVRQMISQGMIPQSPAAVANFIRKHAKDLDKVAVGEYFGHHDPFPISVMHAFIDQEKYGGMTIDVALRELLKQFRLPGEAQKIDRIMEKFAERFYLDNPGLFHNAEGAYLLSFAIVMLNTDAHNPQADRLMDKAGFVAMCYQNLSEEEGGGMVPILEQKHIEDIFDRIVTEEIKVHGEEGKQIHSSTGGGGRSMQRNATFGRNLASAMGLRVLAAPFKPFTRNWNKAAEGLSEEAKKKQLLDLAQRAVQRGVGSVWVSAVHAELVRPMLTVSAEPLLGALASGISSAANAAAIESFLAALITIVELAAMLQLDGVCESAVGVLAAACGVTHPAPVDTPAEGKQLAALKSMMSLVDMQDVSSLGSAWIIMLRTASQLEALSEDLLRPDPNATPAPAPTLEPAAGANPFNKMFQAMGISLGGAAPVAGATGPGAGKGMEGLAANLRQAPGLALAAWSLTQGKATLEQLYSLSSGLDGEAVVVYFRALAAVSREELDMTEPRTACLTRLVGAAHQNTDRIRLIWSKLWSIIGSHLVATCCHPSQLVALRAANDLKGLGMKLLGKTELVHFRGQGETLLPFVSVLRQCDDAAVREAVIAHLHEAIKQHQQHGLGSGWRTLLDALNRAAGDSSAPVVSRSVAALQIPMQALYGQPFPQGHAYLHESVAVAVTAAQNSTASPSVSVSAVQQLLCCAAQLSQSGNFQAASVPSPLPAQRSNSQSHMPTTSSPSLKEGLELTRAGSSAVGVGADTSRMDGWSLLLFSLAQIAYSQEQRPMVATAAVQVAFDLLQHYCHQWPEPAWTVLLNTVIPSMFHRHNDTDKAAQQRPSSSGSGPTVEFMTRVQHFFPLFCDRVQAVPAAHYQPLLHQMCSTALVWLQQGHDALIRCGLYGIEQLMAIVLHRQDLANAEILLAMLQPVLNQQLEVAMHDAHAQQQAAIHQQLQQIQSRTSVKLTAAETLGAQSNAASHFGTAGHMLLSTHRVMSRIHEKHHQSMPWKLQEQLLHPLVTCVQQCMKFNQQLEQEALHAEQQHKAASGYAVHPATNEHSLHAHGPKSSLPTSFQDIENHSARNSQSGVAPHAGQEDQPTGGSAHPATNTTSTSQSQVSESGKLAGSSTGDIDEKVADSILEAGPSVPPRPSQTVSASVHSAHDGKNKGRYAMAAAGNTGNTGGIIGSMQYQVSLVRLELEAAGQIMDACALCMNMDSAAPSSSITNPESAEGATKLLRSLCEQIVHHGAAVLTATLHLRFGADAKSQFARGLQAARQGHAPVVHQVECTWLEGMRAPLLARAIQISSFMPGSRDVQNVRQLFPHMLAIMCSSHAMAREAVAVYFDQTIRSLVMTETSAHA